MATHLEFKMYGFIKHIVSQHDVDWDPGEDFIGISAFCTSTWGAWVPAVRT